MVAFTTFEVCEMVACRSAPSYAEHYKLYHFTTFKLHLVAEPHKLYLFTFGDH